MPRAKRSIPCQICLLLASLCVLIPMLPRLGSLELAVAASSAGQAGVWSLAEVKDFQADGTVDADETTRITTEYDYRPSQFTARWTIEDLSEGQSGSFATTARYGGLPQQIAPGQPLSLSIELEGSLDLPDGETYSEDDYFPVENWVTLPRGEWQAENFDDAAGVRPAGQYEYGLRFPKDSGGVGRQEVITGALLDKDKYGGEELEFTFAMYSMTGSGQLVMSTTYVYRWQTGAVSVEASAAKATSIALSGVVRSIDNKPMPRLKMEVQAFYDQANVAWEGGSPDQTIQLATDLNGAFACTIPIPGQLETVVGLVVTTMMRCALPQGQDAFFMADYQDPAAKNEIRVSTLVLVDPGNPDDKDTEPILVSRALHFQNVNDPPGFLSVDDDHVRELMYTNLADPAKLGGYSYVYRVLWDAFALGGGILGELPALLDSPSGEPLRIDCNFAPDANNPTASSHYRSDLNAIRLEGKDCQFDDHSRFTALHEFGHFFEAATNFAATQKWLPRCDWVRKIQSGDQNHGGYLNQDTADSFIEGFAMWYAALGQSYRQDSRPMQTSYWNLDSPGNWVAWKNRGLQEDMTVGAILTRATMLFPDIQTFWQDILRPDRANFSAYYDAIITSLGAGSAEAKILSQDLLAAGMFKMPFGNGQYDPGEPFRDSNRDGRYTGGEPFLDDNHNGIFDTGETYNDDNNNNRYDQGSDSINDTNGNGRLDLSEFFTDANQNQRYDPAEIYGDLMYAVDPATGQINPAQTLQPFDPNTATLGQASDHLRVRKTVQLLENSSIALSGEATPALKVTVRPDGQEPYAYLVANPGSTIYIGLPNASLAGQVELSVPGGATLLTADLGQLQDQIQATLGQAVPLAAVDIRAEDLAPAGTRMAPTGGSADASGLFVAADLSNAEAATLAAGYREDTEPLSAEDLARSIRGEFTAGSPDSPDGPGGWSGQDSSGLFKGGLSALATRIKTWTSGSAGMARLALILVALASVFIFIGNRRSLRTGAARRAERAAASRAARNAAQAKGQGTFCPGCGTPQSPGARFCKQCGTRLKP